MKKLITKNRYCERSYSIISLWEVEIKRLILPVSCNSSFVMGSTYEIYADNLYIDKISATEPKIIKPYCPYKSCKPIMELT